MGAWKPSTALLVTQMRFFGIVLNTSVQAERHGPSMITRSPDCRTRANTERKLLTSPPELDRMRKSARTGSVLNTATRTKTIAMMNPARGLKPMNLAAIGLVPLLHNPCHRGVAQKLAACQMLHIHKGPPSTKPRRGRGPLWWRRGQLSQSAPRRRQAASNCSAKFTRSLAIWA